MGLNGMWDWDNWTFWETGTLGQMGTLGPMSIGASGHRGQMGTRKNEHQSKCVWMEVGAGTIRHLGKWVLWGKWAL